MGIMPTPAGGSSRIAIVRGLKEVKRGEEI
jgi:hypothetical protein